MIQLLRLSFQNVKFYESSTASYFLEAFNGNLRFLVGELCGSIYFWGFFCSLVIFREQSDKKIDDFHLINGNWSEVLEESNRLLLTDTTFSFLSENAKLCLEIIKIHVWFIVSANCTLMITWLTETALWSNECDT